MTANCLDIITQITVELHKADSSKEKLGSGVLYYNKSLSGMVYVLTAKHCLSGLAEKDNVSIRVYCPNSRSYQYVTPTNQTILRHSVDDAGIIIFNHREIASINLDIPSVYVVDKNVGIEVAVTKGFPLASLDQTSITGESSLAMLRMYYRQEIASEPVFQLTTQDDYNEDTIVGMSGAGVFVEACDELYINGIFTRFTDAERGKVIYAQRLTSFNELLGHEYKKKLPLTYLGHHSLGHKTFESNVTDSVANLGPRYCRKVNVKTGSARYFDCVAKTPLYYKRLSKTIDSWLTEKSYRTRPDSSRIGKLEEDLKLLREDFVTALSELDMSVEEFINFSDLMKRVDDLQGEMEEVRHNLYLDYSSTREDEKARKELEADESRLTEISRDLHSFSEDYADLKVDMANNPYMIIKGEAGCGKSHLLGDVASNRIAEGLPTLLFLGTDFNDRSYEAVITSKTGFSGTFPEFLSSFNQIGCQVGSRALLMIDALNEGDHANLWKNKLPGLIKSLNEYPAIGLVVSVRDTYFDDVIPDDVEASCKATVIEHKGFKGLEYEAVKQFCLAYNLKLPNVPILTPEFCNPLFLKIVCDTLEASGKKDFPKGFNGVITLFNQYFRVLDKQFGRIRPEYKYKKVVSTSVKLLAIPVFEAKYNLLKMLDAESILHKSFPNCTSLLADLIDNNVLLKTKPQYGDENEDCVVFCYQRISDFTIASETIKQYQDWEAFSESVKEDKALREIIVESHWLYKGILEAFATLIPETFGHEISELIRFIPKKDLNKQFNSCLDFIAEAQISSLNWRSIESINKDAIRGFLDSKFCRIDPDIWYYKLTELSTIPNHPFNADYFHAMMLRCPMPQRDGVFQFFFNGCAGYDDEKCANPLRRLIDWAWSEGVSESADPESARLAAIMLCWLLSSTYIKHRDEATKALVNLLSEKVIVLIETMRSFEKVDDMYISERLFAVAYGVALRTSSDENLEKLAKYVYDTIFKHNNPPKNILLRDHARNIIEYANYKVGLSRVDMRKVRPPYSSPIPKWPTDEEVEYLHISYDASDFKERKGAERNMIWESVKGGLADFWNKLAEPVIENFYPISIAEEKEYQKAERLFKGDWKKIARVLAKAKANSILNGSKESSPQTFRDKLLVFMSEGFEKVSTEEQLKAMKEIMIPFYVKVLAFQLHYARRFPSEGVRNWIVKRAYELGFDVELHGRYDRFAKDWTFRNSKGGRIDRVGKKYQWIAFHEVMGILADNYRFEDDYANEGSGGYEVFHGTWQSFLRNINPSMIAREKVFDTESIDNDDEAGEQKWYQEEMYDNWEYGGSDEAWASLIRDLPDPVTMIQKVDDSGTEWLTLNNSKNWDEPKELGKEKHEFKLKRHDACLYIDAILLKKDDVDQAIKSLDNRNLWGSVEVPSDDWQYLVNREKYWSPAYKDVYRNEKDWTDTIDGLNVPFIFSTEKACGHIEGDQSGTISKYSIPCRRLFEGLGMVYDARDGQYVDKNANLIAITYGYDQILVKKAPLLEFLEQSGLAILWIVRGDKRVYVSGGMGCLCEYDPCGIYYMDVGKNPVGVLKSYKRV